MNKYRCDDCEHSCKLEISDNSHTPTICVIDAAYCGWSKVTVIYEPENVTLSHLTKKAIEFLKSPEGEKALNEAIKNAESTDDNIM